MPTRCACRAPMRRGHTTADVLDEAREVTAQVLRGSRKHYAAMPRVLEELRRELGVATQAYAGNPSSGIGRTVQELHDALHRAQDAFRHMATRTVAAAGRRGLGAGSGPSRPGEGRVLVGTFRGWRLTSGGYQVTTIERLGKPRQYLTAFDFREPPEGVRDWMDVIGRRVQFVARPKPEGWAHQRAEILGLARFRGEGPARGPGCVCRE